jgi:hypothetical protein
VLGSLFFLAWRGPRGLWHTAVFAALGVFAKECFYIASNAGWLSRGEIYGWLVRPTGQLALAAAAGLVLWAARGFILRGGPRLRWLGTVMVPFAAFTVGNGVWRAMTYTWAPATLRYSNRNSKPAAPLQGERQRVVWIVLDELDERIAFSQRRSSVDLPALDRFRREAGFVALDAQSPSNATAVSLPSLLDGRPQRALPAEPQALAAAQRAGRRVGLTGWALPYCEALKRLERCECAPLNWQSNSYGSGLPAVLAAQARSLFETNVFSPFGQSQTSRMHVATLRRLTAAAAEMAASPDLDYVFIHLPAPHGPFVFDRRTGQPDAWSWPKVEGYLDNLVLADHLFRQIRSEMERSGVWERSVVLVTADHGYRGAPLLGYPKEDRHVPFMLKTLPGQRVTLDPRAPLATVDTGKILAGLSGF